MSEIGVDTEQLAKPPTSQGLISERRVLQKKPASVIKAQAAAFTAQKVGDYWDRKHVFKNLDEISGSNPDFLSRTTTGVEYRTGQNGEAIRIPQGTDLLIATKEDYVKYLRSVSGSGAEQIQGRADILDNYDSFKPEIDKLKDELSDPEKRKSNPAFIGSGSNSMVFKIEKDGKAYAVRVPNGRATSPLAIDSHIAGAISGKGVRHFEQIVAASYEDGVTVAEIMPGKEMGELSIAEIEGISDAQLGDFIDSLILAHKKGIIIDPKPSNYFYDPEKGFGMVDYSSSKVINNSSDQDLGAMVGYLSVAIGNAGLYGKDADYSAEDYKKGLRYRRANLAVLKRLGPIFEQKLKGIDLEKASAQIAARIKIAEETVSNYSNPDWVDAQVEANKAAQRERDEQKANHSPSAKIDVDLV